MTRAEVLVGDCLNVMAQMEACSVDAIVTDPPYELGFMGKSWDASGVAFRVDVWREALRVLKPGGHLLAFSGSRTYHRMAVAIEDAGFEIRDQIMWVYGSGFPKSHDAAKAIDREAGLLAPEGASMLPSGASRMSLYPTIKLGEYKRPDPVSIAAKHWLGWGTALKPAHEPIVVARKPLIGTVAANVLAHGTGAINVDGCRVGTPDGKPAWHYPHGPGGNVGQNIFSGLNPIREEYTAPDSGRWPANLIHDGSEEVVGLFPDTGPAKKNKISDGRSAPFMQAGGEKTGGFSGRRDPSNSHDDAGGSAARFFYSAKASKRDRDEGLEAFGMISAGTMAGGRVEGSAGLETAYAGTRTPGRNIHPTVKPTDLMRYLCRLVTPPGGLVLDPFTGSGSTGKGAVLEGFRFIGIELSQEYAAIARARIRHAVGHVAPEPVAQDVIDDLPAGQLRLFA